jgi:hypothetical protein
MAAVLRNRRHRRRRELLYGRDLPRPRVFLDRQNPLETLTEGEVFVRYRFRPVTILLIVDLIRPTLSHPTRRNSPLTPLLQVLVALRFVATGAFHLLVAESLWIAKSTAGRCVRSVLFSLSRLANRFISLPVGNAAASTKLAIFKLAGTYTCHTN